MTVSKLLTTAVASLVLALLALPAPTGAPVAAQTLVKVDIQEWPVPWEKSQPRDPYVDAQGRVWFVGQRGHYVAYLDPSNGQFKKYDLEPGTGPHNLIVDKNGFVWYSGNLNAHIGRLDPKTGAIKKYPMPDPAARDPHTLTFDKNGDIWFTVQGGNFVGKLTVAKERVDLLPVPTPKARPYGIVLNSKNELWFVEFGTNKIGLVTQNMDLKEIMIPRPEARPRRLMVDSKDRVWYVDYATGMLGRYDPAAGLFKEWPAPGGAKSQPYGVIIDANDRIWFDEFGMKPSRFVGFDTAKESFFSVTEIQSGGGVRHMFFHRPANEVWFGTDAQTIGRARLPKSAS